MSLIEGLMNFCVLIVGISSPSISSETNLFLRLFLTICKSVGKKEFEFAKNESELFFNFYESKGWKVGKNSMLIWKSSVATWMITYYKRNKISTTKISKLQVLQKSHEEMNKVDYNEKFKNTINEQFN